MNIAIITARGGSKRLPRKNIGSFCGRPMIAWPIAAAHASGCFEHILVSTDDAEIADIARKYGAEVPHMRPADLADDFTHAHKAARHMLEWALVQWRDIPHFAHIYPTSPFLHAQDIQHGLSLMQQGKSFVYTAQEISFPIYQVVTLNASYEPRHLFEQDKVNMRSQDMPRAYIDAGQLYWYKTQEFLEKETSISERTGIISLPTQRALDIDTEEDWVRAEQMAMILDLK